MNKSNLAICLLTCEIDHLEEWYLHHKSVGFDNFFVFIDNSRNSLREKTISKSLISEIKNIKTISQSTAFQTTLYAAFCKKYSNFDYILFIDSDEYYESLTNNVHEDLNMIKNKYGHFDALGIYWRFYGSNLFFENRVPISEYKEWFPFTLIKSFVNPRVVVKFNDPHAPILNKNSKYIDELGNEVLGPHGSGEHSSKYIWFKHIFTRSKSEWEIKRNRGGWWNQHKKNSNPKILQDDFFYVYNRDCVKNS
jgi:hypothetical protein